jgi:hypothetical protein
MYTNEQDFGQDYDMGGSYTGALSFRPDEQKFFDQWFDSIKDKSKNRVEGKAAIEFFRRSNLDNKILGEIWSKAAKSNAMSLNQSEFFIAMRMISLAQSRQPLGNYSSSNLPLPQMGMLPATQLTTAPSMTKEEYDHCMSMYRQLDPTGKGSLNDEQLTTMLKKTKLSPDILSQAWNMVERNANGMIERPIVIILIYLLIKCRDGNAMPSSIPANLKKAVNEFEGKTTPAKKLDDPFAVLATSLIGGNSNPPPSYPKTTGSSYQGSFDAPIRPAESIKNLLPKPTAVNKGSKIDPSMQSVLEEQDTDLIKGSQLQALDEDGEGKSTSYYISQLNSLNSERIKLKNSIGRQRADIRKEEDYMIHYQVQIKKLIEEYGATVKELEDILLKKASASENKPSFNPTPFQQSVQRPQVNAFPTNTAPANAYPPQRPPTNPPQFTPRPATPQSNTAQPAPQPRPPTTTSPPSFQPAPTVDVGGNKQGQEFQGFDAGDSAFGWGNDDFGNTGVLKGTNEKTEPEFDFS